MDLWSVYETGAVRNDSLEGSRYFVLESSQYLAEADCHSLWGCNDHCSDMESTSW